MRYILGFWGNSGRGRFSWLETRAWTRFRSPRGHQIFITVPAAPVRHLLLLLLKGLYSRFQSRHVLVLVPVLALRLAVLAAVTALLRKAPVVGAEGLEQLLQVLPVTGVLVGGVALGAGGQRGQTVLTQFHQSLNFDVVADPLHAELRTRARPRPLQRNARRSRRRS